MTVKASIKVVPILSTGIMGSQKNDTEGRTQIPDNFLHHEFQHPSAVLWVKER